jgi:hypothetical protein
MEEGRLTKEVKKWSPPGRRKRGRRKLTRAEGIRGLMGEKGIVEGNWNDRGKLEEEDNIIGKWAQEDVEMLCSLLNNNKILRTIRWAGLLECMVEKGNIYRFLDLKRNDTSVKQ